VQEGANKNVGNFAEEDGEGAVALDSVSRAVLMSKLVRPTEDKEPKRESVATSPCISLKNMFSPADPEIQYVFRFSRPENSVLPAPLFCPY
jgi:hypothetical protein